MKSKSTIHTIFPNFYNETWVSYTVKSILTEMKSSEIDHQLYVLSKGKNTTFKNIKSLLPRLFLRYTSPFFESKQQLKAGRIIANRYMSKMSAGDIAYFWLNNPPDVCMKLKSKGVLVVREMINCTLATRKKELGNAYELFGKSNNLDITDEDIEYEKQQLLSADLIFCSSDQVLQSVLNYGVAADKCVKIGYGWEQSRFNKSPQLPPKKEGLNALFVGTVDVRKGAPILFDAWEKANIKGNLTLAGRIDDEVREKYVNFLQRPDVIELGHVTELESVYRSSDVFCFLSWEEGCPLVTLEAIGCGLPCIVTPMGSAGAVKNLNGGLLVNPGDINATVQALTTLANDKELLKILSQQAESISYAFTWENAGKARIEAIKQLLGCTSEGDRNYL